MPLNPVSIGDHIRRRRIELGLFQAEVGRIFKVSKDCITFWENNRSSPLMIFYPRIIEFLGYIPFDLDISTEMGSIKAFRYLNGLSQKNFAKIINIDPKIVSLLEIGERSLSKKKKVKFQQLFAACDFPKGKIPNLRWRNLLPSIAKSWEGRFIPTFRGWYKLTSPAFPKIT